MADKQTQVGLGGIEPVTNAVGMLYNIGSGIANQVQNAKNDKWNKAFAREQFDYQKSLNDLLMQREDTAVQRRAKDLEAAGLSKTLAAGDAAQSSVAGISPLGSPANSNKQAQQLQKMDIMNSYAQYKMQMANRDARVKEGELISAEADTQKSLKSMYEAQADNYRSNTALNWHNYDYATFFQLPHGLSARAGNKYELFSSLAQWLIKYFASDGEATTVSQKVLNEKYDGDPYKYAAEEMRKHGVSEKDIQIMIADYKKNIRQY